MKSKTSRLQIVFDFDGVMSGGMYFNERGKAFKHFQYCIRYAIDMLNFFDCDCYVLSGDSTEQGQAMTKKILENVNIKQVIFCKSTQKLAVMHQMFGNVNKICYIADDLYDILVAPQCAIFCTNSLALPQLQKVADYVSTQTNRDYFVMDVANWIVTKVLKCKPEWYCQFVSYNKVCGWRRLELFDTNKVLIVGETDYDKQGEGTWIEPVKTWWNLSMKQIMAGQDWDQLNECYNVQYIAINKLTNFNLNWNTFAFVMPDAMNIDFARLLHLTKSVINFADAEVIYDDFKFFVENAQRANDMLKPEDWQCHQFYLYLDAQTQSDWIDRLCKESTIEAPMVAFVRACTCWFNEPVKCC